MRTIRRVTIWTIIILACLLIGAFAEDTDKAPDASAEHLKAELAARDIRIAELEGKLKQLEGELESAKKMSNIELQALINDKYGEYEGVISRVILSGNDDEIRIKLEIDLSRDRSSWNRLTIDKRKKMLEKICDIVSSEHVSAKIKGYIKDISDSKRLLYFYNTSEGAIEIGTYKNYNTISILEDRFNNEYDAYFNDIHFTFALNGNENRVQYTIYIQRGRFEEKWNSINELVIKNFMKKLCSEIKKEFPGCSITGSIYDTDGRKQLSACEQNSSGVFNFNMEP